MKGEVGGLWRYPVGSLLGEDLAEIRVLESGLAGDRAWGLFDAATGEVAAPEARLRWRPAGAVAARLPVEAPPEVRIGQGAWQPSEDAGPALTAHFGFPAVVRPFGDGAEPRYRRDAVHLLTTASLATLRALLPESRVDPRRFRANLLVEWPEEPGRFPETEWGEGRRVRVGGAVLEVHEACARCAFTAIPVAELPLDAAILQAIVQRNAGKLGVLCRVLQPGRVALGDAVEPL